jgi:hypothetical protein
MYRGLPLSTRDAVHDVEDAKAPAVGELVVDEVERPACVGLSVDQDRDAYRAAFVLPSRSLWRSSEL